MKYQKHQGKDNYAAVARHYQFADFHNGFWYVEIVAGATIREFYVQEVRNGELLRRSREPKSFAECQKIFWARTHRMSIDAGFESEPPKVLPRIVWR